MSKFSSQLLGSHHGSMALRISSSTVNAIISSSKEGNVLIIRINLLIPGTFECVDDSALVDRCPMQRIISNYVNLIYDGFDDRGQ